MPSDFARRPVRVGARNATFQHWETLLRNRTKRHRAGEFVVQGVRAITLALQNDWPVTALIRPDGARPSEWARGAWADSDAARYELDSEFFAELSDKDEGQSELLAVVAMPADDMSRVDPAPHSPLLVFDRPSSPGNIGTLLRSIDAFGGSGLVVCGHAADPYDPKSVRASTGSLFTVPVVRADSPTLVLDRVRELFNSGTAVRLLGTDEDGTVGVRGVDFAVPTVLVIGNETRGLAKAWRESCDEIVSIPMIGNATSLNAATAGSILLHEALQQRLMTSG